MDLLKRFFAKARLESNEYIFQSPFTSGQCLNYLSEYNHILPNRIEFKGKYLSGFCWIRGIKFKLSIYDLFQWLFPLRWFYGEIIDTENGCLIKGKFKMRIPVKLILLIFSSVLIIDLVTSNQFFPIQGLAIWFLLFGPFYFGICAIWLKFDGNRSEEYIVEFMKEAFKVESAQS